MTTFWSFYIILLTVGSFAALFWIIFSTRKGSKSSTTNETMGHSFDGIEEFDNPMPKWWLYLFLGSMVFGAFYLALYPGLGNSKGLLPDYSFVDEKTKTEFTPQQYLPQGKENKGWTAAHQWEKEEFLANQKSKEFFAKYNEMSVEQLAGDHEAMQIGEKLFSQNCALCHASDAKGSYGFPNLTDKTWRWGGDAAQIKASITNGRNAIMAPHEKIIGSESVNDVAAFVSTTLMGRELPEDKVGLVDVEHGKEIFSTVCFVCHGAEGKGNIALGAPDLTDVDALIYGSRFDQVAQTIRNGRQGKMPAQKDFLSEDKIHILSGYIYSLSNP